MLGSVDVDIDRINKVISYISSNVRSVKNTEEISSAVVSSTSSNRNAERIEHKDDSNIVSKENYGADRYLICNPNVLYRYVNRSFISKNTFRVNKAAYAEAAKKYGHKNIMKKSCFEESYI